MKKIVLIALVIMLPYTIVFAGVYTDNSNSTITDAVTTCMWQKQDDGAVRTWEGAISYCEGLTLAGYTDWRLPNIKELGSLVDDSRYSPSINTTYFLNTQSTYYWSSTTYAGGTTSAWYVDFNNGFTFYVNKTNTYYVRCVRSGQ